MAPRVVRGTFIDPAPPSTVSFDAKAARALSLRSQGLHACLADMKKAVTEAASSGEFSAFVPLPEPVSTALANTANSTPNTSRFLIEHLNAAGLTAWSEAAMQAVRAGYSALPAWCTDGSGPSYDGILLSWSMCGEPVDDAVLLMPARRAHETSMAVHAHARWVDRQKEAIHKAASKGLTSCSVWDGLVATDEGWGRRREMLHRAGFATDLIATGHGAELVIRW